MSLEAILSKIQTEASGKAQAIREAAEKEKQEALANHAAELEAKQSRDVEKIRSIEDLCKIPFYSPRWSPAPVLTIVPHLFGTTAYKEVALPLALYVNFMESFIPGVYRNCPFVAISESTKKDLARRGIPVENIAVIPCGIDTDRSCRGLRELLLRRQFCKNLDDEPHWNR